MLLTGLDIHHARYGISEGTDIYTEILKSMPDL
jgi:hypothetical protein